MSKKDEDIVHIMIDIETLGKTPGSVILSIGAVVFDIETGDIMEGDRQWLYSVIDLESCLDAGLTVDASTLLWWMSDDQQEARSSLLEELNSEYTLDIRETLRCLAGFIEEWSEGYDKIIWANPPTFDLMILESAYNLLNIDVPWNHYEMMDLRTLKKFYTGPRVEFEIAEGVKHNALYDAKLQAKICSHIWKHIGG